MGGSAGRTAGRSAGGGRKMVLVRFVEMSSKADDQLVWKIECGRTAGEAGRTTAHHDMADSAPPTTAEASGLAAEPDDDDLPLWVDRNELVFKPFHQQSTRREALRKQRAATFISST